MVDENVIQDEVGEARGPQGAAQAALNAEIAGHEGDGGAGDQPPPEDTWEDIIEVGLGATFDLLSSRWKSFETSEKEIQTIARAWAPVLEKHAGAKIPMEYMAVGVTLAVVVPKAIGAISEERQAKAARMRARTIKPEEPPRAGPADE